MNNIFDRNSFDINAYPFSPSAKGIIDSMGKSLKIAKIILLAGIMILAGIFFTKKISLEQFYFYVFALVEIYVGYRSIVRIQSNKRVSQLGVAERFDLYLYQFHKLKARNTRTQGTYLLLMAKQDIAAGNYDRAAAAISYVNPSSLKGYFRKLYNILTYSISLRCSDFATADRMFNEYVQNGISANQTFPHHGELWNWRNNFSPEQISYAVGNISSFNERAGVGTIVFITVVFASWLIGLGNEPLRYTPLITSNIAIIYCALMAVITLLCFISILLIRVANKDFVDESRKTIYVGIGAMFLFTTLVWGYRILELAAEWLYLWM